MKCKGIGWSAARSGMLALWMACSAASSKAVEADVVPLRTPPVALASVEHGTRWQIGPLVLTLPRSWRVASPGSGAVLIDGGPRSRGAVSFLVSTPEAAAGGYSALEDSARGPAGFRALRVPQAFGCRDAPQVEELGPFPGRRVLALSCPLTEASGGGFYVEYGIYSKRFIGVVLASGRQSVAEGKATFGELMSYHEWIEDFD